MMRGENVGVWPSMNMPFSPLRSWILLALLAQLACGGGSEAAPPPRLNEARWLHTATLLANGKVLIAGGESDTSRLASAELYDPATNAITRTGSMASARMFATATLLPNGKVLVTGGVDKDATTVSSAELYDPATGAFTPSGAMARARKKHTATLLPNGKVLIVGGSGDNSYYTWSSAELYDPATGTFTPTGPMAQARCQHTATLLPGGRVLVAGGWCGGLPESTESADGYLASAELYDPATGAFTPTGGLAEERCAYEAILLPGGKVLCAGGYNGALHWPTYAECYDPSRGTFSRTGHAGEANWSDYTATLMPSGKVLLAGGLGFVPGVGDHFPETTELYDPATGQFTLHAARLAVPRTGHTATLLANGAVLLVGGKGKDFLMTDTVERIR